MTVLLLVNAYSPLYCRDSLVEVQWCGGGGGGGGGAV